MGLGWDGGAEQAGEGREIPGQGRGRPQGLQAAAEARRRLAQLRNECILALFTM